VSGHRSAAVLACTVARKRLDALAQGIEARRFPGIVSVLSAMLEAVEGVLSEPGGQPSK
jgi:hypothetical protein